MNFSPVARYFVTLSVFALGITPARTEVEIVVRESTECPVVFTRECLQSVVDIAWFKPEYFTVKTQFAEIDDYGGYRYLEQAVTGGKSIMGAGLSKELVNIGQKGKRVPPFVVLTSPNAGETSPNNSYAISYVNGTRVGNAVDGQVDLSNFRLIDLFGCRPDGQLHQLVESSSFEGMLVLPFPGIDFSKLEKLPTGTKSLVVYNSVLGKDFLNLVSKLDDLTSLVLWGCAVDESFSPHPEFATCLDRLTEITFFSCGGIVEQVITNGSASRLEKITGNFSPRLLARLDAPILREIVWWNDSKDRRGRLRNPKRKFFESGSGKITIFEIMADEE